MTEEEVPNTTFLKWVVIILGILIVGVASAIGVILYKRAVADEPAAISQAKTQEIPSSQQMPAKEYGVIDIDAPEGMSAIGVSNSEDRLLVVYGPDASSPRVVIVVQQQTGKILGRINVQK
ncbi:MAG: hypothetical protein ABJN40_10270 [Sneathiella sp.]